MVHRRDPLTSRSQNKKVIKRKPRPQWDSSINDVSSMKLSKSEQEKRTKLYSAKHMEKIRNEIKSMQRKEKSLQNAIHSSPFVAHNKSIVDMEVNDTRAKLQELLNETDRKMAEAKDLFGDHGFKYRVIPNVTSAPHFKHSPITLSRTAVHDTPSPPTALNDTQKLGIVTVETLPPDTSNVDLTRIRHLLNQEKENLLLTAQNTLLNSTTLNTAPPAKVNKVLDFNEDIPTVRMGDRSRRKVRISDSERVGTDILEQERSIWSPVPVEATQVVMSTKPDKRDGPQESSPPRLRESSSESLVSPSRIKKQQSLEKRNKARQGDVVSPSRDGKSRTPETTPSPVRIATKKKTPPAHSTTSTTRSSGNNADNAPALSNSVSEHHYPQILKIPVIKENSDVESANDDGTEEEIDPVRGSRSPSGRKSSPRNKLVNTATSPLPTVQSNKQTHSITTSPVTGLESPVKVQDGDKDSTRNTERESYDRHYTDQELKDRLERLIVGGHYPFAKIEQKSYAIADPDAKQGDQNSDKEVGTWIRANFANEGENLTFVDSSPLKGAALDLELKLRKYQSQIGAKPAKNNAPVGGFSGYTSLLLRSVSTMIGYLTEQESGTMEEQNMRAEVIETMSALQNTVEALSTELLACRKDLSETKEKVQAMEHDYSTTLMFLVDNCVLKDPSLQTPLSAQRIKQLPTVISPFTTTPPQPPTSKSPDLMTFTPHPNKSENLIEFTPAQPRETDSIVQITPETSEQYLQFLEEKTQALRSGLDEKMNRLNVSMDKDVGFPEIKKSEIEAITVDEKSYLSAPNKSGMSSLNFSNLTEDGLDLSQDLDALIDRLKQMNAQTLAVTSQQMGLTPRKNDNKVDENLSNIKDMLDVEQTKPLEAATRVIESYKRQSDFSPSQLLPDFKEQTPDSETKQSTSSDQLASSSLLSTDAEISPVFISPPGVIRGPGRISGEFIGTFSGTKPVADRPVTPNPLSPRRVQEEIKRSTEGAKQESSPKETQSEASNTPQSSSTRLDITPSNTTSSIHRSNSAILQSPSAFSPPTKESPGTSPRDPTSTESSPKQDKAALINDFLSHNPHYLKKISESLTSASLPSFPTSPTQVSTARVSQDDGVSNGAVSEGEKSPPVVKSSIGNTGVTEAVVRGSVTKNIAKFEKRREEAELERERSISPKRSPVRRGKSGSGRSPGRPRSALSPERKPGSPERRVKHRVSWGDDQLVQEAPLDRDEELPQHKMRPKMTELSEEESEIVMKPDRTRLPDRRVPDKNKTERKFSEKTKDKPKAQGAKSMTANVSKTNGVLCKSGSTEETAKITMMGSEDQGQQDTDSRGAENGDIKFARSESSGSDMMAHLMSMNDAKLTELMTTLNKLTER